MISCKRQKSALFQRVNLLLNCVRVRTLCGPMGRASTAATSDAVMLGASQILEKGMVIPLPGLRQSVVCAELLGVVPNTVPAGTCGRIVSACVAQQWCHLYPLWRNVPGLP
eukprot:4197893-Amphidinium_carterae.1